MVEKFSHLFRNELFSSDPFITIVKYTKKNLFPKPSKVVVWKIIQLSYNKNIFSVFLRKTICRYPWNTTIVTIASKYVAISNATEIVNWWKSITAHSYHTEVGNITKNRTPKCGSASGFTIIRTRLSFVQIHKHNFLRSATLCTNVTPKVAKA